MFLVLVPTDESFSLQATWIRNALLRAIRSSKNKANVHYIPLNFVYRHPTIQELGDYFWMLLTGVANASQLDRAAELETACLQMQSLVTKYTTDIPTPAWVSSVKKSAEEIVILTGSTGRLGCHLLKLLIERSDVAKVYALNRRSPAGKTAGERQQDAFMLMGIDLKPDALQKVVFLSYDTSKDKLGLEDCHYRNVR
jgi:hypothetical protein